MEVQVENCAGIDVHQKILKVCIIKGRLDSNKVDKSFIDCGTTTKELKNLASRLKELSVSHVFMESTSQYWVPVHNILEMYDFEEIVLANPQRIKGIPGRKTDQSDSQWIAELGRLGLIPRSYVPSRTIQDFRRLTRTKSRLIKDRSQKRNRIHNVLQQANIKLTSYLSDIYGVTGSKLLNLLINGENLDIDQIGTIVTSRIKAKPQEILDAMEGSFSKTQADEIKVNLNLISTLDTEIKRLEESIEDYTSLYSNVYEKLLKIPGIGKNCAAVILAEIGPNVDAFETVGRLSSWVGICPGSYESAGKVKSSHITQGNKYLKEALYHAGRTAAHSNSVIFRDFYLKIANKGSKQKAVIATAHKILKIVYKILKDNVDYIES
jgi:Transposase and inactivated derivatives